MFLLTDLRRHSYSARLGQGARPPMTRRVLSLLAVFEGIGFSLLFTTGVVIVGRLLPRSLYSTGNAVGQMVSFGIGPILGAGLGGFVY